MAIPIGTAYATWTGIGAAGTALLGMILLGESTSPARVASLVDDRARRRSACVYSAESGS